MAYKYTQGETVKLDLAVTDADGTATSPSTSMKVSILAQDGTKVVDAQDMTEDGTGDYSYYEYTIAADAAVGKYTVEYAANNGGKVTIEYDYFEVKARKGT